MRIRETNCRLRDLARSESLRMFKEEKIGEVGSLKLEKVKSLIACFCNLKILEQDAFTHT